MVVMIVGFLFLIAIRTLVFRGRYGLGYTVYEAVIVRVRWLSVVAMIIALGGCMGRDKSEEGLLYVIQKHAATRMHYDLRLEIDGKLISWALPKNPSNSANLKRLAVYTTAHPMSYATFEGEIPEGNYGAGTVMVWDTGTYSNIKEEKGKLVALRTCLKNGLLEIFIRGEKLHGAFALVRLKSDDTKWLFIKMHDEHDDEKITEADRSALSGRTMAEIKKDFSS